MHELRCFVEFHFHSFVDDLVTEMQNAMAQGMKRGIDKPASHP